MRRLGYGLALTTTIALWACGGDDTASTLPETFDDSGANDASTVPDDATIDLDSGGGADGASDFDASDGQSPRMPFALRTNGEVYALHHAGNAWFVGGDFSAVNGAVLPRFGVLESDGSVSSACDVGAGFDGEVRAIAKAGAAYFIGGHFSHYKGQAVVGVAKVDATTCALDTTFSQPNNGISGNGSYVDALVVAGNSVYIGGYFTGYRGVADAAISLAKLDATTGALDTTFSPPGATANGVGVGYLVYSLALTADALYIGGYFNNYRGVANSANWIAKVDPTTGVLDTTFSPPANNGFNGYVAAIAVNGNSLYVGGGFNSYRGAANAAKRVAKLDRLTGALDTTFTKPNSGFDDPNDIVRAIAVYGSSVYVGGEFTTYRGVANSANSLAKLDVTSGNLDTTFSPQGLGANGTDNVVSALAATSNALYVGGYFDSYRGAKGAGSFAKVDPVTGVQDTTFHPVGDTARGFGTTRTVYAISTDGTKVAVGGQFNHYAGKVANGIAKVDDVSYAFDSTFAGDGSGFDHPVSSITSIGSSIYVGGYFTAYRGVANAARYIAKLDANSGNIDTSFSPPGATSNGFDSSVLALAHSDTALYVGGNFSSYRGMANSALQLAKLDPTSGSIDTTFSPAGAMANGFDDDVYAIEVANGAVYVGGRFRVYRGVADSANHIAKLNASTGAIDTMFNPQGANANGFDDDVYSIRVAGNSVYVGGEFVEYRGVANSAQGIAKLDATTGAIDTTFSTVGVGNGFDSTIYSLAISGDAVYAAGDMSTYRGKPAEGLAKLDRTNGTLDTAFSPATMNPGSGFSAYTVAIDGDSLFAGGYFTSYRGKPALGTVRVDLSTGEAR